MIKVTNFNKMPKGYNEYWAIVRSYKNPINKIEHIDALSPSYNLFQKYLTLRNCGKWNMETFNSIYVPQFLSEIKENQYAKQCLNYLCEHSEKGERICLMCFCSNEELCHRSIIAGLLNGVGCDVSTDTGETYSSYYEQYVKLNAAGAR